MDESCCCQWWQDSFEFENVTFITAEHAMMYGKAKMFGDKDVMQKVLSEQKPHKAKELGRLVKGFDDTRWYNEHYQLVRDINLAKFSQIQPLQHWLMSHPDNTVFVEASPFDGLWGIKRENTGQLDLTQVNNWAGLNKLGFAITEVFQKLKQG